MEIQVRVFIKQNNGYLRGIWTLKQSHEQKKLNDDLGYIDGNLMLSKEEAAKRTFRMKRKTGLCRPWKYDFARHGLFLNWRLQDYKLGNRKRTFMNNILTKN